MFRRPQATPATPAPAPDAFTTPPPGEWFVAKVTSVPSAGQYAFDEYRLNGDGTWAAVSGGRVGTSLRWGVALTGTFAVNDYAWARAAPGAGGLLYELLPVGNGAGVSSPLTTKGDVWGYSTTNARIPVGSNGQVLTADSAQTLGLKWAAPAGTVMWVARLTTASGVGWKWFMQSLYNSGGLAYHDVGGESASFNARPAPQPHNYTPAANQRVLMWASFTDPTQYEFIPHPASASASGAGLVDTSTQTFAGEKTFEDDATFEVGIDVGERIDVGGGAFVVDINAPGVTSSLGLELTAGVFKGSIQDGAFNTCSWVNFPSAGIADGTVPNNSIWKSDDGSLKWKNNAGTITVLA